MSPATLLLALSLFFPIQPESPAPPKAPEPKPAEIKPADAKPETKPEPTPPAQAEPAKPADPYVLGHTVTDIDGKDQKLDQYKGKVVLIVNVASKCGLTPQYKSLQKLFDEKKDKGLVILGFPANNFAGQEPGKDADIKAFCEKNFGVTFPMFAKVSVKGDDQHALFKQLAGQPKPVGGDPTWNFTKFLVNREGKVVARFEPRTDPSDATLGKKIDELLAEGQPSPKPADPTPAPAQAEKPVDKK